METDNELVKQIRQTLDNYQEEYIPGSWERFADKQKKRKRLIFIRWSTGMAASLLIGLFVASWVFNSKKSTFENQVLPTAQTNIHQDEIQQTAVSGQDSMQTVPQKPAQKRIKSALKYLPANLTENNKLASNQTKKTTQQNASILNQDSIENNQQQNNHSDLAIGSDTNSSSQKNTSLAEAGINVPSERTVPDSQVYTVQPTKILSQAAIDSALQAYQMPLPVEKEADKIPTGDRVRFGVNLSPGVNTTQSATAMNYGGGVNTDIKLFGNVALSTGLQLEQQNVVDDGSNSKTPSGETNADLLTLDVPINITWKFYSHDSKSYYVSSGISSMAYLDQKYENTNYEYTLVETTKDNIDNSYTMAENRTVEETEVKPFETFDFAGRVNIVFGLEQRLTPKLNIHIEPYVKIPISGLGSERLKFTTSGITCKVSF